MTHRSFIAQYYLGPEMSKNPPFVIHDARKKSDGRHVVVKMLGKLGYPPMELIQLQKELKFWRLVSHARIVELLIYLTRNHSFTSCTSILKVEILKR